MFLLLVLIKLYCMVIPNGWSAYVEHIKHLKKYLLLHPNSFLPNMDNIDQYGMCYFFPHTYIMPIVNHNT